MQINLVSLPKEAGKMKVIYEPKGAAREYAAFAANLYRGCGHGCTYCYAPKVLRMKREEFHKAPMPREGVLGVLKKELETGQYKGKQILLSFTSDPYQLIEFKHKVTMQAFELFTEHDVHWNVLTKSHLAERDFHMYREGDAFGMTLTRCKRADSGLLEPNATTPGQRALTLSEAHSMGIRTWVSLEPVISEKDVFAIIDHTHEFVDHYKVGKLNYSKDGGHDWAPFTYKVIEKFQKLEKSYYIKKSLQQYVENVPTERE
jgi:DNA repair photolyase